MIRLYLAAGAAAAVLAGAGGLYLKGRADVAEKAKAAVAASQAQTRVAETTTRALDTHTTQTIVIKDRESRNVQAVQAAPGAGDRLPDSLMRAWRDGLRDIETGAVGDNRSVQPEGAVRAP